MTWERGNNFLAFGAGIWRRGRLGWLQIEIVFHLFGDLGKDRTGHGSPKRFALFHNGFIQPNQKPELRIVLRPETDERNHVSAFQVPPFWIDLLRSASLSRHR